MGASKREWFRQMAAHPDDEEEPADELTYIEQEEIEADYLDEEHDE